MTDRGTELGRPTGWVVATADLESARARWTGELGFTERAALGSTGWPSLVHPATGQVVTLVELPAPDPATALAVEVTDLEAALERARSAGMVEHWRDSSEAGTDFVMCRSEPGVFVLLYRPAAGSATDPRSQRPGGQDA